MMLLCSFGEGGSSTVYQGDARLSGKRGRGEGQPCCPRLNGIVECYFSLDYTGAACDSIELIARLLSVNLTVMYEPLENLTRTDGSLRLQVVI
jgi:hypothetical protein